MNKEEYLYMNTLKESNPEVYNFINNLLKTQRDEISFASHEIKNQLSFIISSYQLISRKYPETADFAFWSQLGASVNTLINFMERTSLYRYSFKANPSDLNITKLLYSLPDIMDEHFPAETRHFDYDIDTRDIILDADYERLSIAFTEILTNAYEASEHEATIYIGSRVNEQTKCITVTFTNPGNITPPDETEPLIDVSDTLTRQLCTPFYTDKKAHSGLGLAIVNEVCCTHNAELRIDCKDNKTAIEMTFPIKGIS